MENVNVNPKAALVVILALVAGVLGYRVLKMRWEVAAPLAEPAQPQPPPPPPISPAAAPAPERAKKPVSPGVLRQQFPPTRVERPFEPIKPAIPAPLTAPPARREEPRSEERRVGKECRL